MGDEGAFKNPMESGVRPCGASSEINPRSAAAEWRVCRTSSRVSGYELAGFSNLMVRPMCPQEQFLKGDPKCGQRPFGFRQHDFKARMKQCGRSQVTRCLRTVDAMAFRAAG